MRYRKKPIVVDAFEWTADQHQTEDPEWITKALRENVVVKVTVNDELRLSIRTLEGTIIANRGDYIIRGVAGEIYPCKPDIFLATYDLLDEKEGR